MTISIKSNGDSTGAIQHNAVDRVAFNADGSMSYPKPQRGAVTTDNDLSFSLNATNNFGCTPTAGGTLTFTDIASGQSGTIILSNTSNYSVSKSANVKTDASFLTTVSSTGTYRLSYYSDGTNVYVSTTGALS